MQDNIAVDDVAVLITKGVEEANSGNKKRANQYLRRALSLDPENETCLLWLAWVTESAEESVQLLEKVVSRKPNHYIAKAYLQQARMRQEDEELAKEQVEAAVTSEPEIEEAKISYLGEFLVTHGYITKDQLENALSYQNMLIQYSRHKLIGQVLVGLGHLRFDQLQAALKQRIDEQETELNA